MKSQDRPLQAKPGSPDPILDALDRLARKQGTSFTMAQAARAAGVSRATLYRRFPSRRALLSELRRRKGLDLPPEEPDLSRRVLGAARRVMARKGFAVTMEDIAAEAQVSPASVYRKFGDKDGLMNAFLDEYSPRRAARTMALGTGGDLFEDLARYAEQGLIMFAENGDLLRLALAEPSAAWDFDRLSAMPRGSTAALEEYFRRRIEEGDLPGQDPHRLALAFGGLLMIFGFIAPRFRREPIGDMDETGRFIATLFLHGARGEERGPKARRKK